MSDRHLHHEGHELPDQDWTGGPVRAYINSQLGFNPVRSAEAEEAYRELMLEDERQKKLAKLGERFLEILTTEGWQNEDVSPGNPRTIAKLVLAARALGHLDACPKCKRLGGFHTRECSVYIASTDPPKPDHASQDRASFEKETLERYMGGE